MVTGYLDRRAGARRRGSGCPPARRWTPPRCCTAARSWSRRPSTTCPTTGCSTSTGTSCRATRCRCSGCPRGGGAGRRRGRRDLRGPVAGRRAGRGHRAAGAGLLVVPNASPYERGKDDTRLELCQRRAARGGRRAGLREHGRRPGRAGLRRRLDHRAPRTARCWPAGRSSRRPWSSPTWTLPAATAAAEPGETPADARDGTAMTIRRLELPAWPAAPAAGAAPQRQSRCGRGCADLDEVYAALVTGVRDYVRKNGFRLGDPRPVRRHRLGADRDDRRRRDRPGPGARGADAEPVLLRALGHRRRGPGQAAGPARPDGADRSRWSTPSRPSWTCTAWPRRTCRPGSAA